VKFGDWAPKNAGGNYAGSVTLADAFARSINTVAVKLAAEVGPEKVRALANRFGMAHIPPNPSLTMALGTYETTLLELVSSYQVLQQGGRRSDTHLIDLIATPEGTVLYRHAESRPRQVYDARLNGQMVRMMEGVVEKGTGRRAALGRPVAGKTGTSQNDRDAWFVGFTPELVTGVWIGDDQSRPMRDMGGGDLPAEMWKRFMTVALTDAPAQGFSLSTANQAEEARAAFYAGLATELEQGARDPAPSGPAVPATGAPANP
jgi:penicillin-binding protein 1A